MLKGSDVLSKAELICRADETTDSGHREGTYGRTREVAERQIKLLTQFAKATNCWYDSSFMDSVMTGSSFLSSGAEAFVFRSSPSKVMKIHNLTYAGTPQKLLDRICAHNMMFEETAIRLRGFGKDWNGQFCFILYQPFICGKHATTKEIESYLKKINIDKLEEYKNSGTNYKTSMFLFDDFNGLNVIKHKETGNLCVIDSDLKFNLPELNLGGKFTIPSVEEDFKIDKVQEKKQASILTL